MISLAFPWVLVALPLPWLVWRFIPPRRESMPALRFPFFRRIVTAADVVPGPGSVVLSRSQLQMVTAIVVWCLLILALARPERLGEPVEITKAGRDMVLAIDISGSMDAVDFLAPDGTKIQRLAAVRDVVRSFVEGRDGDRVALIVFGSRAYLQAPLTEDTRTIVELLDQTDVGVAGPQTALGDAIGLAIRTFEASDVDQRLLILLSDGADTSSRMSPVNAADIARSANVEIFTVGVGDPEATGDNRVDVKALEVIAQRTGGEYFFASDQSGLGEVYRRIDALTPRSVETLSYRPRQSLSYVPLILASMIGTLVLGVMQFRAARAAR